MVGVLVLMASFELRTTLDAPWLEVVEIALFLGLFVYFWYSLYMVIKEKRAQEDVESGDD